MATLDEVVDERRRRARRGDRHHQPARDGRRLGPHDRASRYGTRSSGRTAAPRRAATSSTAQGHLDLVRARTGLVLDPYFSGTKFEWLLREGGVDVSRRPRARHDRHLAAVEPHRRRGARHRSDERQPHDAVRHRRAALGRRAVRSAPRADRRRCPRCCPSSGRFGVTSDRCAVVPPASRSAASPATSRRRCSARRASSRAWPRTPTAPAASCC